MKNAYTHSLVVNKKAIDTNNHVNNIYYIQWMQDGASAHSDSLGFNLQKYNELGATWVIKSHQIDYIRSAFLNDEIDILTWISKIEKSKFTRQYTFTRKSDNKILAKAQTVWVYFDTNTNRPSKKVDVEILNAFKIET